MQKTKVKLTRSLRKSIQQGHPWVYKEAISAPAVQHAGLAQVSDNKGELAWAIYDPHSPLALRILSTESAPPSLANGYYTRRFEQALRIRDSIRSESTNAFRLFAGEGDGLPGLVCDVYNDVAVLQFDGRGPREFWTSVDSSNDANKPLWIADWLIQNLSVKNVIEKSRRGEIANTDARAIEIVRGPGLATVDILVKENGAQFKVNLDRGQKTGFFLDQRDNRMYVRSGSSGKSVLNLFSYTGGFSINAGIGGASRVTSVDLSQGAIEYACENWKLNGLSSEKHEGVTADVFEYLKQAPRDWDHVIVDPPSMTHSEERRDIAIQKYSDLFSVAATCVGRGRELSLSSCSSHVSFEDFFEIISSALTKARRRGQILRVAGQGPDHPFPHACPELRYLKYVHLILN